MGRSSTSGGSGSGTPARTNNNYAAPHTPIASVKRPRSSIDKSMLTPKGGLPATPLDTDDNNTNPGTPKTPGTAVKNNTGAPDDSLPMSPMHAPRPLVRKAGATGDDDPGHHHAGLKGLPLPALEGIAEGEVHSQDADRVDALFSPLLNLGGEEDDEGVAMDEGKKKQHVPHEEHEEEEVGDHHHHHEEDEHSGSDTHSAEGLVEDDGSSQGSLDDEDEFNPYVFIKSLPNYDLVAPLRPPIALAPKLKESPPISLVLDLDETLVHCTVEPIDDADLVFPVVFHGVTYQVHVRLRPHLFQFLEKIRGKYEVIVFTASQKVYANELLDLIDPDGKYIQYRMFRESCLAVEGNFLKDLTVLGRDLSKSVLVDNSPHAFGYQVDNGIPIESWFDDPNDTELLKLERFLRTLHGAEDVRDVVRDKFQTYRLVEEA